MNLAMHLTRAALSQGDATAIRDGDRRVSYAQLEQRCNRLAHALIAAGIGHGDRVALALPNSIEWIEADFAIAKTGAMSVPLSIRNHEAEMARMIALSGSRFVVSNPEVHAKLLPHLGDRSIGAILVGSGDASDYEAFLSAGSPGHICAPVDETRDGRLMRFTSGTTGQPKGVFLTHENWLAVAHSFLLDAWPSLGRDDVILSTSPYAHMGGLWLTAAAIRGASISVYDKFDGATLMAQIRRDKVTIVQIVPTALRRLLDAPGASPADFATLKSVCYGSSSVPASTLADALRLIGPKLTQLYGLNEAPPITVLTQADHDLTMGEESWRQPIGRDVTLAEVTIRDPQGKILPNNEIGEIVCTGPMVFREYLDNPAATAETKRDGKSLWTGDLGFRGDNGIVYLTGRLKEVIITGGYNVSPYEVEAALDKHDAVHQCAVIGEADPDWGEKVVAYVVLKPGKQAGEDELIEFCRSQLTSYKKPKAVRFVNSLPVNANGKVQRRLLKEAVSGA